MKKSIINMKKSRIDFHNKVVKTEIENIYNNIHRKYDVNLSISINGYISNGTIENGNVVIGIEDIYDINHETIVMNEFKSQIKNLLGDGSSQWFDLEKE